ncbi:unnamed protein product [Chironomus riparius]|uniref:RNA (guanine-9-)-methyltransferase domain-containing protein 1 n=1 Tax=Chironomus riparius TaxID=315576 RepID=A0A9N9S156_9DIPT|nr:unnamed protein product [Chironomus riparius]
MLRLARYFGPLIRLERHYLRCFSTEPRAYENAEKDKKFKILELEIDIMRQEGRKVPSKLSEPEWDRILELGSVSARRKYLTFLFTCEMKNLNKQKKKEDLKVERDERIYERRKKAESNEIVYGLGYNSYFLKIYETTMNLWNNNKLVNSMLFGQKLVIDCSYDEHMNFREADNCAKQLTYTFAMNRLSEQPFDLHYCNFDRSSKSGKKMMNSIPTMFNLDFPINVHEKSYIDVFDKSRLVYLTPHCRNELVEYNHDDIYIVGAMVDKEKNEPHSLAKAKKYDLRMAKLPLDKYLDWGKGGKSLTINQMLQILYEMKETNDWNQALRFVPRRKLFKEFQQSHLIKDARNRSVTVHKSFFDDDEELREKKSSQNSQKERKHFQNYFDLKTWGNKNSKNNSNR